MLRSGSSLPDVISFIISVQHRSCEPTTNTPLRSPPLHSQIKPSCPGEGSMQNAMIGSGTIQSQSTCRPLSTGGSRAAAPPRKSSDSARLAQVRNTMACLMLSVKRRASSTSMRKLMSVSRFICSAHGSACSRAPTTAAPIAHPSFRAVISNV